MAAKRTYKLGSKPRLQVTFTNPDTGAVTDPSSVVLKVQDPSLVTTTYTYGTGTELTKVSTGIYKRNITLDEAGTWEWTFTGTTTDDATVVHGELLCEDPGF